MKVYEIIAESKDLEEGLLDKAFGLVAGKATRAASREVAKKAAEKAANAKALGQFKKLPALAKAGVIGRVATTGIIKLAPWALHAFQAWQIYGMVETYNENVEAWDKKLQADVAAGKLSQEEYESQLAGIRNTEMGLLTAKIATAVVAGKVARGGTGILGNYLAKSNTASVRGIGHTINGLGRLGSAYLFSQINSPEGSQQFANVLTGTAIGDFSTQMLGTPGVAAVNWLKGTTDAAAKVDTNKADAGANKKPDGQGGSDTKVDEPHDGTEIDRSDSERYSLPPTVQKQPEDTPAGYKRDAKGNLIHVG